MKACKGCGLEKQESEFYKAKTSADGLAGKCKSCVKEEVKRNRLANADRYKAYDRQRGSLAHRKEAVKNYQQTPKGRERSAQAKKGWAERNLIKRAAQNMVSNALRYGKLTKQDSCDQCGTTDGYIHGHHDDYAAPLVVRWLCAACHSAWHKVNEPING